MQTNTMEQWTPIALILFGIANQWLFGFRNIPSQLTHLLILSIGVILFLMGCGCKPEWSPSFFIPLGMFILALRGAASYSRDVKIAPKSDTL